MSVLLSTTTWIIILCCYVATIFVLLLQHYLYEKMYQKNGKKYVPVAFRPPHNKVSLRSKEYWINSLDGLFIIMPTLLFLGHIEWTLNIEFPIFKGVMIGFLIYLGLYLVSQIIACYLYKLYIAKRKKQPNIN